MSGERGSPRGTHDLVEEGEGGRLAPSRGRSLRLEETPFDDSRTSGKEHAT